MNKCNSGELTIKNNKIINLQLCSTVHVYEQLERNYFIHIQDIPNENNAEGLDQSVMGLNNYMQLSETPK